MTYIGPVATSTDFMKKKVIYMIWILVSKILCEKILELDKTIRFVGIANLKGKMIAQRYRKGLRSLLLTKEESQLSAMQSIIRMGTRKVFEGSLVKQYMHLHYMKK